MLVSHWRKYCGVSSGCEVGWTWCTKEKGRRTRVIALWALRQQRAVTNGIQSDKYHRIHNYLLCTLWFEHPCNKIVRIWVCLYIQLFPLAVGGNCCMHVQHTNVQSPWRNLGMNARQYDILVVHPREVPASQSLLRAAALTHTLFWITVAGIPDTYRG